MFHVELSGGESMPALSGWGERRVHSGWGSGDPIPLSRVLSEEIRKSVSACQGFLNWSHSRSVVKVKIVGPVQNVGPGFLEFVLIIDDV